MPSATEARLEPGAAGTVVEIGGQAFDNTNVCQFANDGACDDPGQDLQAQRDIGARDNRAFGHLARGYDSLLLKLPVAPVVFVERLR